MTKMKVIITPEVLAQIEQTVPPEDLQELLDFIKETFENFDPENPPGKPVEPGDLTPELEEQIARLRDYDPPENLQ